MFGNRELAACQARKAALLQQSDANREVLAEVARALRPVAAWVDVGVTVARRARTVFSALAPWLSLWRSGKEQGSGFIGKFAEAMALGRSLSGLWKRWREDARP